MALVHLACPDCRVTLTVAEALAAGTVSWPRHQWVLFTCPACGADSHLEVRDGRIGIGSLDGGPGPVWMPHAVAVVQELSVDRSEDALVVRLPPDVFRFPART